MNLSRITLTKVLSLQSRGGSGAPQWVEIRLKDEKTTDLFVVFYEPTYFPLFICFSVAPALPVPVVERPVLHSPEVHPSPRPETTEPAHQRHWRAKTRRLR